MTNFKFFKTLTTGIALATALYPQAWACEEGEIIGAKTGNCIPSSGSCGTGCNYTLDIQGNMRIFGTGKISSVKNKQDIINVKVENGITGVENKAFYGSANLKRIDFPETATNFGTYETFVSCNNLEHVTLPENLRTSVLSGFMSSNKLTMVVPEGMYHNETFGCCGFGYFSGSNIYCTGAQIAKGICSSNTQHYEKDGNNYIVYNSDGSIKDIFQKFGDFTKIVDEGFEDKNFVINDDGSISLVGDNGILMKYDAHGNITAAYDFASDGSVYIRDANGKLIGAKKTSPFTPAEAAALIKKGNVNIIKMTFK